MVTIAQALNHAQSLMHAGNNPAAEDTCRRILQAAPKHRETLLLLGNVLLRQQKLQAAEKNYRDLVEHHPTFAEAHNNLGIVLAQLSKPDEALAHFDAALRLKPNDSEAGVNRGRLLQDHGSTSEAIAQLQKVLRQSPDQANAHLELGHVYTGLGKVDEVIHHYEQALRSLPNDATAHWNLARARLTKGDYLQGWRDFEWRWKCPEYAAYAPNFLQPSWNGETLDGRTILIWSEQGLGDTIQFVRYVPLVKRLGARTILRCPKSLFHILRSCHGIDTLVASDEALPEFDWQTSLLSLPRIFGTTLDTIPSAIPYLSADPTLVQQWRERLSGPSEFKIGIVWQGSSLYPIDQMRSIPLNHFESLSRLPGVQLYSLQKGPGTEQLLSIASRFSVVSLDPELDTASGAFMDTAAVMQIMDLIVTCDTSIAHLAGALGVPTWIGITTAFDWRWMLDRDDSPWYPSMRIFRQTEAGNWSQVFETMAVELLHQRQS